jgi:hypothetical protein
MLINRSLISSGAWVLDFVFDRSLLRSHLLEVLSLLSSYKKSVDFVIRLSLDNVCYSELSFYYKVDEGFIYCSCKGLYLNGEATRDYRFSCSKGVSWWRIILDEKLLGFVERSYKGYMKVLRLSSG